MTKQVALSDHAYDRLRKAKLDDESFSDVVERLVDQQAKDPRRFSRRVAELPWRSTASEQTRRIETEREATREPA